MRPCALRPPCTPARAPQKDLILLKVNKLSSVKTQLPYEYYSLPYCRPEKIIPFAENLGEVLRGDRIENSLYQVGLAAAALARRQRRHACAQALQLCARRRKAGLAAA